MRSLKKSLQSRFVVIVLFHTLVTLVSVYIITLYNLHRSAIWELERFEASLLEFIEEDKNRDRDYSFFTLDVGEESRFSFVILFKDGTSVEGGRNTNALREDIGKGFKLLAYKKFAEYRQIENENFTLSTSVTSELDLIDDTFWAVLLLLPFLLLPALYFSFKTFGQITNPLKEVSNVLAKIEEGELTIRLPENNKHEEVEKLYKSLNSTLTKLEELFQQSQNFNAHAAHQLKTPLAVLRGEIDICFGGGQNLESYENCLQSIQEEIYSFSGLVDNLLMISSPGDEVKKNFANFHANESFDEVIDLLMIIAEKKGIELSHEIQPVDLFGSKKLLSQAFFNLIENALKYSPENSQVSVAICKEGFSVKDQAMLIQESEKRNILQPFYRKNSLEKGSGLGLNVVDWICRIHGFQLLVESSVNGNEFKIKF